MIFTTLASSLAACQAIPCDHLLIDTQEEFPYTYLIKKEVFINSISLIKKVFFHNFFTDD